MINVSSLGKTQASLALLSLVRHFNLVCSDSASSFSLYFVKQTRMQHKIERTFTRSRSRKEVFQPHLPVRLPCYDLAPITGFTLGRSLRLRTSGTPGFHGLTGGVYKARERIHRAVADARLLANPAS